MTASIGPILQDPSDRESALTAGVSKTSPNAEIMRNPGSSAGASAKTLRKVEEAAQEFESLLLTQVLRTARESGSGGWMGSKSSTSNPTMELAEAQLARAMAQRGVLGLTQLLSSDLAKRPAGSEESAPAGTAAGQEEPAERIGEQLPTGIDSPR